MYPTLKVTRKKVECFNEGNFYVTELTANEVKEYNLRQKQREEDEDNLESAYDLIVLGLVKRDGSKVYTQETRSQIKNWPIRFVLAVSKQIGEINGLTVDAAGNPTNSG